MGRIRFNVQHMLLSLLMLLMCCQSIAGEIYRCQQKDGGVRFQGTPCEAVAERTQLPNFAKQAIASTKHFIWQAQKPGQKGRLYLLGSIHFGKPGMYPLPSVMTDAFAASDSLVVEANIEGLDPQATAMTVARYGVYQDGSTLRDHIGDQTWQALEETAHELGMSPTLLQGQKPWLVSMSLSALMLNKLGYQEALGIDRHFLLKAEQHEVIELEGLEFQLRLFEKLTAAEQEAMLLASLEEMEQGQAFFERLFAAWKQGDGPRLDAIFNEGFDDSPVARRLMEVIMFERNWRMADLLTQLSTDGRTHFVVVGAGHLPGEEGLINLLQAEGFKVSQL